MEIVTMVVVLAIAVALFLILRNVVLWYWGVNSILNNQEKTNELLKQLVDQKISTEEAVVHEEPA